MTTVRQTGNTVEVAIEKALDQLKVSRNEVEVEVLSAGKKGFLGFGAKEAEVVVTVKAQEKEAVAPTVQPTFVEKQAEEELEQAQEEQVTDSKETTEVEEIEVFEEVEDVGATTEAQNDLSEVQENPVEKTVDYLTAIAKSMDIEDLEVTVTEDGKYMYLQMDSEKAALIIGKRGQTLNALQQLAQLIANQHSKQFKVVRLNVGDYRERREQSLAQLADRMADKAIETGRKVQLEPMPSYERKVLHHTLADRIDIETYSEGADPHRYLVIEPIQ